MTLICDGPTVGVYTIDPTHTTIDFTSVASKNVPRATVRATFSEVRGVISVGVDARRSSVNAEIVVGSIATGDVDEDRFVQGPALLDGARFPTITYSSVAISSRPGGWAIDGALTLCGVTRRVPLALRFDGVHRSPLGDELVTFTASAAFVPDHLTAGRTAEARTARLLTSAWVRADVVVRAIGPEFPSRRRACAV